MHTNHTMNDRTVDHPAPRTKRQQEAARQNGRQSRGPITTEGKRRSAQNSVTHGIFRRISPQADPRGEDELYRRTHQELVQELQPATFSARTSVSHLAQKHVQLLRVVAMIEQTQAPPCAAADIKVWREAQQTRKELALLDDALGRRTTSEPYYYSEGEATQLADMIIRTAQGVLNDLAEAAGEDAVPEDELYEDEVEELRRLRELGAMVHTARRRLDDRDDLAALLRGDRRLRRGESRRLAALLGYRRSQLQTALFIRQGAERHVDRMADQATDAPLRNLDQLERLEAYRARLERAIERQTRELGG